MHPRTARVSHLHDFGDRVAGTRADVAGLRTDDDRPGTVAELRAQGIRTHAALLIHRHRLQLVAAKSEIAQGADRRDMNFAADQHAHARGALQPLGFHVPSGAMQHLVARGREAGEVRHVAAGHEAHSGRGRQSEQLHNPPRDDVFHH